MNLRENWRILMLVVLVVGSTVMLFPVPGLGGTGGGGNATQSDVTNLQYGLELAGGTRVRAPLVGYTASGVDVPDDRHTEVSRTVANELDLALGDVSVAPDGDRIEVYADRANGNVSQAEFAAAISAAGFEVSEGQIRDGVTSRTRQEAVRVLNNKINRGGLTGGSAQVVTTPGQQFILVEVPGANRSEVLELIGDQGQVQVVALFPDARNGTTEYRRVPMFAQDGIAEIGTAQTSDQLGPHVPVQLTPGAAQNFSNAMTTFGFTDNVGQCPPHESFEGAPNQPGQYCLMTVVDDRDVFASSLGDDLAGTMERGNFVQDPRFVMQASNLSEAQGLEFNLRAGALPTELAIQSQGTTFYVEPSLAEEFKLFSVLTGGVAVLAVALVVFARYGRPRVAAPMLVTATAEVYLLLGFAATVGLALDLSHIAGFIAVIGTGVDDLVIIADEILQRGEVSTGKVFRNRFRKAFWVIGAAAATTIIAMSPLAVLSLGDLQGFAIVTIVGVLLGVLVTRPAYGDILRNLMLAE